jgi:hypothetical protein
VAASGAIDAGVPRLSVGVPASVALEKLLTLVTSPFVINRRWPTLRGSLLHI